MEPVIGKENQEDGGGCRKNYQQRLLEEVEPKGERYECDYSGAEFAPAQQVDYPAARCEHTGERPADGQYPTPEAGCTFAAFASELEWVNMPEGDGEEEKARVQVTAADQSAQCNS